MIENLMGKRFNELSVIRQAEPMNKRTAWLCLCSCGAKTVVRTDDLVNGKTKSCGHIRAMRFDRLKSKPGRFRSRVMTIEED